MTYVLRDECDSESTASLRRETWLKVNNSDIGCCAPLLRDEMRPWRGSVRLGYK